MHNTANRDWLAIDHPRETSLSLSNAGQLDRSLDVFAVAGPSGRRERQKQAQPEKASRPLNRCHIGVKIGDIGGHVTGRDLEGGRQHVRVPGDEHAAAHRRREPLVGIDRQRVGLLDACERTPQPVGRDERAAPCRVHVVPETHSRAISAHSLSGSIIPAFVVPAVAAISDGNAALRAIAATASAQRFRVHASGSVSGHQMHCGATYARLMSNFKPRKMAVSAMCRT